MGRRKIEIQPILHERNRSVTFLKRKNGLFKKAYELGVLCQVEVAVIIFEDKPGHHLKLYQYGSDDVSKTVQRHLRYEGEKDSKGPKDFQTGGGGAHDDDDDEVDDDEDSVPSRPPKRGRNDGKVKIAVSNQSGPNPPGLDVPMSVDPSQMPDYNHHLVQAANAVRHGMTIPAPPMGMPHPLSQTPISSDRTVIRDLGPGPPQPHHGHNPYAYTQPQSSGGRMGPPHGPPKRMSTGLSPPMGHHTPGLQSHTRSGSGDDLYGFNPNSGASGGVAPPGRPNSSQGTGSQGGFGYGYNVGVGVGTPPPGGFGAGTYGNPPSGTAGSTARAGRPRAGTAGSTSSSGGGGGGPGGSPGNGDPFSLSFLGDSSNPGTGPGGGGAGQPTPIEWPSTNHNSNSTHTHSHTNHHPHPHSNHHHSAGGDGTNWFDLLSGAGATAAPGAAGPGSGSGSPRGTESWERALQDDGGIKLEADGK